MKSDLPKVLQPLADKPLLIHVIDQAKALCDMHRAGGVVTVVYGHGGDRVRALAEQRGCITSEQAQQLGTGHAVMQALPHLADQDLILILYADVPLLRLETLATLAESAREAPLVILTVTADQPDGYGRILRDAAGRILGIVEHKDANPGQRQIREINTGIMAVQGAVLRRLLKRVGNRNAQGEYYLTDIVALAVEEGLLVNSVAAASEMEVMGVNDKRQLAIVERAFQQQQADILLRNGVTLRDPARFDLRGSLKAGKDVEIDVNAVFQGEVILGNRVRIGAHCSIKDAVIGDDVVVHPNSVIEDARIGDRAQIGPFARIRPGAELGEEVRIGNFVEVKKTRMGPGSKANHLAYVGDADIGSGVNIGAGVITCNYDGANKHKTLIGDDAFIGSDCQLVAPVEIGAGATLGAGTTLVSTAPAGKLTISRPRQITIENWQRPVKKPAPDQ